MIDVPPLLDLGHSVASPGVAPSMHGTLGLLDAHGDVRPLEEIEAEVIRFAIAHYRGQMSEVARRLQIGRSTLYRKLENLGLAERAPNRGAQGTRRGALTLRANHSRAKFRRGINCQFDSSWTRRRLAGKVPHCIATYGFASVTIGTRSSGVRVRCTASDSARDLVFSPAPRWR